MIKSFNLQCEKAHIKNRILINEEFPTNKLVTIMKPYLFLYCKALYSFHPQIKKKYSDFFKLSMLRFNKFNPQFGRKRYKILYKTNKYFKKRICGKEIVFDDNCVNFYDIEKEKDMFLSDHLKYDESENDYILNNYDDEEYDDEYDEEYDDEENIDDENIDEEEDIDEEEGSVS
jgi:hypothetical protein